MSRPALPEHEARRRHRSERQQPDRRRRDRARSVGSSAEKLTMIVESATPSSAAPGQSTAAASAGSRRTAIRARVVRWPRSSQRTRRDRGAGGHQRDRRQPDDARRARCTPHRACRCRGAAPGATIERHPATSATAASTIETRSSRASCARSRAGPVAPAGGDQPERERAGDRQVQPEDRLPGRRP